MKKLLTKLLTTHYSLLTSSFTLIELLIAIGIMSILATAVVVALNPTKQFTDALNSRRTTDVQSILSAIQQYTIDNKGSLPSGMTADGQQQHLGTSASGCTIATAGCNVTLDACLDLSTNLTKYIKSIPQDPKDGSAAQTKYAVLVETTGIMTVQACGAEGTTIKISR